METLLLALRDAFAPLAQAFDWVLLNQWYSLPLDLELELICHFTIPDHHAPQLLCLEFHSSPSCHVIEYLQDLACTWVAVVMVRSSIKPLIGGWRMPDSIN